MAATDTEQREQLWGEETMKAVENFPVSGQPIPAPVVHWLGRIKAAAARVNAELGLLDPDIAERIGAAGDAIAAGEYDDQFPIDVFQTGSGTSSNMNANEVMANLAGDDAHPNDHVNMGQSSNDVFPSAVHLAALEEVSHDLLPAMDELALGARAQVRGVRRRRQGRAHAPDGCGSGDARARSSAATRRRSASGPTACAARCPGWARSRSAARPPAPDSTPTRSLPQRVRAKLTEATGLEISEPADPFEAQGNRDALVELSGMLKVVAVSLNKIANDLALMGSGPRAGLAEIKLPALQKGSSIMPGKVNPVIPEVTIQVADQVVGNDAAITMAGSQGQFELNVRVPLIARNLLDSIKLLAAASRLLDKKCVKGIEADEEVTSRHAEATLATATALNPHIGYDRGAEIVKEAHESGRPIREVAREMGVDEKILDEALDHRKMARPHD